MRILFLIVILAVGMFLLSTVSFAQELSTPLKDVEPPKQIEVGLILGVGYNFQTADYLPSLYHDKCLSCMFDNGDNAGYTFGMTYQRDFIPELQWGSSISIIGKGVTASYIENETVPVEIRADEFDNRIIPFRNEAEFNIVFLSFEPYLKWSPTNWFFVRFGVGGSIPIFAEITQTKELLKFRDTLSTGEIVTVKLANSEGAIEEVDSREIPEVNSFQFSLEPAVGFNFEFSPQLYFSPVFQYSIPLTDISSMQPGFRVYHWRINFEIRIALQLREYKTFFTQ